MPKRKTIIPAARVAMCLRNHSGINAREGKVRISKQAVDAAVSMLESEASRIRDIALDSAKLARRKSIMGKDIVMAVGECHAATRAQLQGAAAVKNLKGYKTMLPKATVKHLLKGHSAADGKGGTQVSASAVAALDTALKAYCQKLASSSGGYANSAKRSTLKVADIQAGASCMS